MYTILNDFVLNQIVTEINTGQETGKIEEIRQKMSSNKILLAKVLMKKPVMQNLFANFISTVKSFVRKEINFNSKEIN